MSGGYGLIALGLLVALTTAQCAHGPTAAEISRKRAIEIALQQVSFEPEGIDAARVAVGARPIWRIALRGRLPGQPPGLFETRVVEIDRQTGEVVSVARN